MNVHANVAAAEARPEPHHRVQFWELWSTLTDAQKREAIALLQNLAGEVRS